MFDGTAELDSEDEACISKLLHGQSLAAGDLAVGGCPFHYVLQAGLSQGGDDYCAEALAGAILDLLGYREGDQEPSTPAAYGVYRYSSSGKPLS